MNDRASLPPGPESLRVAEERQRAANDRLEATLGVVEVTDEQRLAVIREIYGEMRSSGGSTVVALERYEDRIRGRARA